MPLDGRKNLTKQLLSCQVCCLNVVYLKMLIKHFTKHENTQVCIREWHGRRTLVQVEGSRILSQYSACTWFELFNTQQRVSKMHDDGWRGVKKYSKLRDAIYGRPLITIVSIQVSLVRNVCGTLYLFNTALWNLLIFSRRIIWGKPDSLFSEHLHLLASPK